MFKKQENSLLAKKYAWSIVAVSMVCAIIMDTVCHNGFSGILFFILNFLAVFFGFWLWQEQNKNQEKQNTKLTLVWLLLTLTLSVWLFIRDSVWLYTFNFLTALSLGMLFWINSQKKNLQELEINFILPIRFISIIFIKFTTPWKSLWNQIYISQNKRTKIFVSIFLTLPVVFIICALLYSADLVVQKYIDDIFSIFDFSWLSDWLSHIFIIIYFFVFCGIYYALIRKRKNYSNEIIDIKKQDKTALQVVSITMSIILFIFSWIQVKYLFINTNIIEALDIGYQEYAHKGFYQLMIVAVIVFSVIWLLGKEKINNINDTRLNKLNLILSFVLISEIIFVLISAMKRLWLFIDALQWATKRFFAFEGMIFFIIILIIFCFHLIIKKFTRQHFLYIFTILFAVNILFINIINVDKFIARKNVDKYIKEQGEEWEFDFDYSAYVSADAIDEGLELFNNARTDKEKIRAAERLDFAFYMLDNYKKNQFYFFHFAKNKAYIKLQPQIEEIKKYLY